MPQTHTHANTQNLQVLNYYYGVDQAGTAEKATTNPKKTHMHLCKHTHTWRFPMEEGPVQQHTMLNVFRLDPQQRENSKSGPFPFLSLNKFLF